jgi:hypothetical protein
MPVFNWLGDAAWVGGKLGNTKAAALARYFRGTWTVTVGTTLTGSYGTTQQSYYGPYITHVVDTRFGGIAGFLGNYLNDVSPFMGLLTGISGYVTWVYGPNITVNYGGPVATVTRAASFSKTAQTADKKDVPLGLWGEGTGLIADFTPAGKDPKGADAKAINEADQAIVTVVNILSLILNLTVAALELAVKFAYSDYDPKLDHMSGYDPSKDNSPTGGDVMDFIVTQLPPRLMGVIYAMEKAGSLESWWMAAKKPVVDFFDDVINGIDYASTYIGAKMKELQQGIEDVGEAIAALIKILAALLKTPGAGAVT